MLHGCGVVSGCLVRAAEADWTVRIEPGYALGPQGDEIIVDGMQVDLSAQKSRRGDRVYVAIACGEANGDDPHVILAAVSLRAPKIRDEDIDTTIDVVVGHPR